MDINKKHVGIYTRTEASDWININLLRVHYSPVFIASDYTSGYCIGEYYGDERYVLDVICELALVSFISQVTITVYEDSICKSICAISIVASSHGKNVMSKEYIIYRQATRHYLIQIFTSVKINTIGYQKNYKVIDNICEEESYINETALSLAVLGLDEVKRNILLFGLEHNIQANYNNIFRIISEYVNCSIAQVCRIMGRDIEGIDMKSMSHCVYLRSKSNNKFLGYNTEMAVDVSVEGGAKSFSDFSPQSHMPARMRVYRIASNDFIMYYTGMDEMTAIFSRIIDYVTNNGVELDELLRAFYDGGKAKDILGKYRNL